MLNAHIRFDPDAYAMGQEAPAAPSLLPFDFPAAPNAAELDPDDLPLADETAMERAQRMFSAVHGSPSGCYGLRKTYMLLSRRYPGHQLPYKLVEQLHEQCADCQKLRTRHPHVQVTPIRRSLAVYEHFHTISIDGMPISPTDDNGNCHINIINNWATGRIFLQAATNKTAETAVDALYTYRMTYGHIARLVSDPGSDYTSDIARLYNRFTGVDHHITDVDRPQANGTERKVQEAKRFLRQLAVTQTLQRSWSKPRILHHAACLVNENPDLITGISCNDLQFGRADAASMRALVPEDGVPEGFERHAYFAALHTELMEVRRVWADHKHVLTSKRLSTNPDPDQQNKFSPGDFVSSSAVSDPRPSKPSTRAHTRSSSTSTTAYASPPSSRARKSPSR